MASVAQKKAEKKLDQMNEKFLEWSDKDSTIFTDEKYRMHVNLQYLLYILFLL